ncbi:hypothetical protein PFISCL1PPCAC_5544, partial [Pristionchus fissidentatus]
SMLPSRLLCSFSSPSSSSSIRSLFLSPSLRVRRRKNAEGNEEMRRPGQPVQWLEDATTYADAHSVVLDPTTKLPYDEKDLKEMMERTAADAVRESRKMKYGKKAAVSKLDFDHIPIENQVVLLFPGQGAQFVGMGKKLADSKRAMVLFERASEILKYDILELCLNGPKTKLDQTLFCQPAVVVSSLSAFELLQEKEEEILENCTDAAGFSVGEFAALVAGGVLQFDDAIRIVAERAAAMHECSQLIRSGMGTIKVVAASRLDDAIAEARKRAEEAGEMVVCEVANHLYCGVKVIGASETCMRFLEENANTYKYTFVKRLSVSGAFHTRQMGGAVGRVMNAVKSAEIQPAAMNVYSNYTGHVYGAKKAEIRGALSKQLTNPVKWEQIQQLLYRKHKDFVFPRFIECGPGRQLGSMLAATSKKAYKSYEHVDV